MSVTECGEMCATQLPKVTCTEPINHDGPHQCTVENDEYTSRTVWPNP